eukprot:COSAG06_NODE_1318_length_9880_cov_5.233923_2_plen_59_part_00
MVAMMMENPAEKKVRGWLGKINTQKKRDTDYLQNRRACVLASLLARCCAGSRAELAAM